MDNSKNYQNTYNVAFTGMLFATAIVLSILENMLPVLPTMPAGIKLGLSNIITMYALFTVGKGAVNILLLKASFVLATRGLIAACLSLSGGFAAIAIMYLAAKISGLKNHYLLLSILGALGHNFGQLAVAILLTQTVQLVFLTPILFLSGALMGAVTGVVLGVVMPHINHKFNSR